MAVFRIEKTKNYTVMSNFHLRDKDMSLKAKGLLSYMLSLPDDWDYSIQGLISCVKEGEASVKSTLKELKKLGYLEIIKKMPDETESGKIEYEYNVYEFPKKQEGGKQGVENQPLEYQGVENPVQLNTKELNTESLNTNYYKRHKYGAYKNVLLSDEDMEKLKTEFSDYAERIERLSEYIASTGKTYKNHLATIRAWARKEKRDTGAGDGIKKYDFHPISH